MVVLVAVEVVVAKCCGSDGVGGGIVLPASSFLFVLWPSRPINVLFLYVTLKNHSRK